MTRLRQAIFDEKTYSTFVLWCIFIGWALFVSNLWLPRNWSFYGLHDWDLTYATFEAARKSVMEFGQWPVYNPYTAFGTDLASNPQAVHNSIFFIPVLLFGTFLGYKVSILLAMLIGCWGTYLLFKSISSNKFYALCGSLIFVGCSYFSRHVFEAGHSNVLYFYLLPFILHFTLSLFRSFHFWKALLLLLLLVQLVAGGAPFVWISACILVFLWVLGMILIQKENWKTFLPLFAIYTGSFFVSAFKIWPVLCFWQKHPRLITDNSGIDPLTWLQALGDFSTNTGSWHDWFELSMGFEIVLLALIFYHFRNIENAKKWLLLLLPLVWISMGNFPSYFNPWYFLNHNIPVFSSMRAPYRLGILLVLVLSIALQLAIRKTEHKLLLQYILFFAVLSQSVHFNAISKLYTNSSLLNEYKIPVALRITPIKLDTPSRHIQFLYIHRNYSIQNAYEPMFQAAVTDSSTEFISNAHLSYFSPNRMEIIATGLPVHIALRYSDFWQAEGATISNHAGVMKLIPSQKKVTLSYTNPHLQTGIVISLLSLILLCLAGMYVSKKRKQSAVRFL